MANELNQTLGVVSSILENYLFWMPTYLQSLTIFAGFFLLALGIMKALQKGASKLASKTKTRLDDLIIQHTNVPLALLLLLFGIRLAIIPLNLYETLDAFSERLIGSLLIIVSAYLLIGIFDAIIEVSSTRWSQRKSILKLFYRFSRIVIILIFLAVVLDLWGVKIGPLLAGLGVAGIAIAFALQTTLGNIFGGVSLIMDNAYKVGDVVKLDSGEMGIIHKVGIRSTKIKTWDNEIIIVPNGKLADSRITNFSQPDPSVRINILFGVEYGSNPDKVKEIALETAAKSKNVMKDRAPWILFLEMGEFALNFKLMFWVDDLSKKWPTHQEVITNLYNNLNKKGINIAFPTRTLYVKKGKK